MILTHDETSPLSALRSPGSPSSVIRSNSFSRSPLHAQKETTVAIANVPQRNIQTNTQTTFPPSKTFDKKLRRSQSDNIAQSKRDDPSVRRSIFGHYFEEKPRSESAPHLPNGQPTPPIPNLQEQFSRNLPHQSPRRPFRRVSSTSRGSSSSLPLLLQIDSDELDGNGNPRQNIDDRPSNLNLPVDYRVFAPSAQQVKESAICSRYRELNKEHQQDYDSLLERQVQVEHSLPPFPRPLMRFCSDTTATVAEYDTHSNFKNHDSKKTNAGFFSAPDGTMHYHGVYSLLRPSSILRPSRYSTNNAPSNINEVSNETSSSIINSSNGITSQSEIDDDAHISALSSSYNLTRSYIDNSAILGNFSSKRTDAASDPTSVAMEQGEEKKENDTPFLSLTSARGMMLLPHKVIGESSNPNATISHIASSNPIDGNASCGTDSLDKSESLQELQETRRLRFDPRVTVTEFEDPVPRKWYQDHELDQHKREAISLAQGYLREHPEVAEWYRRAILDPITKTHRKRALFSLPVFSSTYSNSNTNHNLEITINNNTNNPVESPTQPLAFSSPSLLQRKKSTTPSVKKILVVHPNPKIVTLFCKSMKSMFPSAELVTTGSSEEALRLIQESFAQANGGPSSNSTNATFDTMIIAQRLTGSPSNRSNKLTGFFKNLEKGPLGILECMKAKKDDEEESSSTKSAISPTGKEIHFGSDLVRQVCELSSGGNQQQSCLLIGVSINPQHDALIMKRAGADFLWGIPIPTVGNVLRSKLLAKLDAKRSSRASSSMATSMRQL